MKLLLFSDVHGDLDACRELVDRSSEADVVVGAGDFCQMRQNLQAPLDVLSAITTPTVLVPGNAETEDEIAGQLSAIGWPEAHVLHGTGVTIDGQPFFGIGGGIPVTPFGPWSYDFSEEEARRLLADCPDGAVLVSHSPPKNAVDRDSKGQSLGSVAVREAVEATAPLLTVCGHIHGSWGHTATIGPTSVFNAGPDGAIWNLPGADET
ncbi:metallophosphoesterase family protein [Salinibacter altiplanensis]|uniref:metallophosphoesterase family protein n=1 Tax=Salinibacter altiplanensis TaxID=1803181 RepID=UPI000C9EF7DE|nr:metallophosphoesterase family protein [Salinibacter altiplanensis]